jgi:hypothetical protein
MRARRAGLLVNISSRDALAGYRALTQAEQDDINRHEQLTLSTDPVG